MKNQALFSSKDKSKKLKCRLLQLLFSALGVKWWPANLVVPALNDRCGILSNYNSVLLHTDFHYNHFIIQI